MQFLYLVYPSYQCTMINLCLRQQICIGLLPTHLLKNTEHIMGLECFSPVINNGNQACVAYDKRNSNSSISLSIAPLVMIKELSCNKIS